MTTVSKLRDTVQDLIIYDFETGGKSAKNNPATEVFLLAIKGDDFTEIARCHIVFLPYDDKLIYEDDALRVTNMSMDYILKNGIPIKDALEKLYQFFELVKGDKSVGYRPKLVAHNGAFDNSFLAQIFSYGKYNLEKVLYGNKDFYGNFQPIYTDSLMLTRDLWGNDPEVTDYKQPKIAEKLGIQVIDAHRSESDVLVLREIVVAIIQAMRNGINGSSNSSSINKVSLREIEEYKI